MWCEATGGRRWRVRRPLVVVVVVVVVDAWMNQMIVADAALTHPAAHAHPLTIFIQHADSLQTGQVKEPGQRSTSHQPIYTGRSSSLTSYTQSIQPPHLHSSLPDIHHPRTYGDSFATSPNYTKPQPTFGGVSASLYTGASVERKRSIEPEPETVNTRRHLHDEPQVENVPGRQATGPPISNNETTTSHTRFNDRARDAVDKSDKENSNIVATGRIENPGLLGVHVNLGTSDAYLVPAPDKSSTPKPVFGEAGDMQLKNGPITSSGSLSTHEEQKFVSVGNTVSAGTQNFPPPFPSHSQLNNINKTKHLSFRDVSGARSVSARSVFEHYLNQHDTTPGYEAQVQNYLVSPSSSSSPPPAPEDSYLVTSFYPALPAPHADHSPLQVLKQYLQKYDSSPASTDASQNQQDTFTVPSPIYQASFNPPFSFFNDKPYIPAFDDPGLLPDSFNFIANEPIGQAPAPTANADASSSSVSSSISTSTTTSTSSGCFSSAGCILGVATFVALTAASVFYIPFALRRRRSADQMMLPYNTSPSLSLYLNTLENATTFVPHSDEQSFDVFQESSNGTRELIFRYLENIICHIKKHKKHTNSTGKASAPGSDTTSTIQLGDKTKNSGVGDATNINP